MTRCGFRSLVLGCALVTLAGPAQAQPFAWWKSDVYRRELSLTADQLTRIDSIFQTAMPQLRTTKNELDRQEAELSRLVEANSDEATISRQVDRVEATRASLNKKRTLMLVHMRDVLTPDQRVKLRVLHEQRDHDRDQKDREHKDRDRQRPPY